MTSRTRYSKTTSTPQINQVYYYLLSKSYNLLLSPWTTVAVPLLTKLKLR